jgi:hypothetical protein
MVLKSLQVSTATAMSACQQTWKRANKHAPVGEKRPAAQEDMWSVARETLKAFQKRSVNPPRAELVDKLVVINRQLLAVARDGALYVPWRHDLLVCR